jgi:hypothetical protein
MHPPIKHSEKTSEEKKSFLNQIWGKLKKISPLGIPGKVWRTSLIVFSMGLVIVIFSHTIFSPEDLEIGKEAFPWKDIVRDIGIAFLVAGTVYIIYEWNTKSGEEREIMKSLLQTVMRSIVPGDLWNEVNTEILHRMVVRCNMQIDLELYDNGSMVENEKISLPSTQKILRTKASYDLYSLLKGHCRMDVAHFLDQHMRSEHIGFPRFSKVSVCDAGNSATKEYTGDDLNKIWDKTTGCLNLSGDESVKLQPFDENSPATIEIERYEIVNTPGLYTLIMPEMVIPRPTGDNPTVRINVLKRSLEDINISIHTWFKSPDREFKPDPADKNKWTLKGILLPGQGFSMVFSSTKPLTPTANSSPGSPSPPVSPAH